MTTKEKVMTLEEEIKKNSTVVSIAVQNLTVYLSYQHNMKFNHAELYDMAIVLTKSKHMSTICFIFTYLSL